MSSNHSDPNSYINQVDESTRANILGLNQKLKGLKAEIQEKLNNTPNSDAEVENMLRRLTEEIDSAIEGLHNLVNLSLGEDEELKAQLLESPELLEFTQMVSEKLSALKKIQEKL